MTLLESLPASVELPAGGGKTWRLTDTVQQIASRGGCALVLTHTNAGVQAIRRKIVEFGMPSSAAHVGTITSFAFELVRNYSVLAGIRVPETPDWDKSTQYVEGASRVVGNRHIRQMLARSFTHLLVDEYQDCSQVQHLFVLALTRSLPSAAVFGDRLQGIFGFRDPIVDWTTDVLPYFPAHTVDFVPWRWYDHNRELGAWLAWTRPQLVPGVTLDLTTGRSSGVSFLRATPGGAELFNAARRQRRPGETTVIVAPADSSSARHVAGKLRGAFTTMEEIAGSFMIEHLKALKATAPESYALWLAELAKKCFGGLAKVDGTVHGRLKAGREVSTLRRPGLEETMAAFDDVLVEPSYRTLHGAMRRIRLAREGQLHSHEAWEDVAAVIDVCADDLSADLVETLAKRRERVRQVGRRPMRQVVSRTVLIKGLEYDHVIVSNVGRIDDVCNLYVALTRARQSVTIIGSSPHVSLRPTRRAPIV